MVIGLPIILKTIFVAFALRSLGMPGIVISSYKKGPTMSPLIDVPITTNICVAFPLSYGRDRLHPSDNQQNGLNHRDLLEGKDPP